MNFSGELVPFSLINPRLADVKQGYSHTKGAKDYSYRDGKSRELYVEYAGLLKERRINKLQAGMLMTYIAAEGRISITDSSAHITFDEASIDGMYESQRRALRALHAAQEETARTLIGKDCMTLEVEVHPPIVVMVPQAAGA